MVAGIVSSGRTLFWTVVLLFLVNYMMAICLLQFILKPLQDETGLDNDSREVLIDLYGSLILAMYTMFQAISGGMDWGDAASPLGNVSGALVVFFAIYVAFSTLCVLNIITGIFVENAFSNSRKDATTQAMEHMAAHKSWLLDIREVFEGADMNQSGTITQTEFVDKLDNAHVQAMFRQIGIDLDSIDAVGLFQLIDFDSSGQVGLDEFAEAIQNLHGAASSIDVTRLRHGQTIIDRNVRLLSQKIGAPIVTPRGQAPRNPTAPPLTPARSLSKGSGAKAEVVFLAPLPGAPAN